MAISDLDSPRRISELRELIQSKGSLKRLYSEIYTKYAEVLARTPTGGLAVELGSGGGFVKDVLPELLTSDAIAYEGIDRVVDATKMPFDAGSVRAFFMMNVFHHIHDVETFLKEASRCLKLEGRLYILDQHPGLIARPILKYIHHEPYDDKVTEWKFESKGPLSDGNGALAWMVFRRDLSLFQKKFPDLELVQYRPHTPLRYWLTAGMKDFTLLPEWSFSLATMVDGALMRVSKDLGSFVDIEIRKKALS